LLNLVDVTSFGFSKSLSSRPVLCKCTNDFGSVFPNGWMVKFARWNSRHTSSSSFPFDIYRITLAFPSTLKTFLLFVTVVILSRNQSPTNCRSSKLWGNLRTNWVTVLLSLQRPGIYIATWKRGRTRRWILKIASFLENYGGTDAWLCLCTRGRYSVCRNKDVLVGN